MDQNLKQKIHKELTEYLSSKNLPNGDNNAIVKELPGMWKTLEAKGLLKDLVAKGFSYKQFVDIALQKKHEAEIMSAFEEKLKGFGFRWK